MPGLVSSAEATRASGTTASPRAIPNTLDLWLIPWYRQPTKHDLGPQYFNGTWCCGGLSLLGLQHPSGVPRGKCKGQMQVHKAQRPLVLCSMHTEVPAALSGASFASKQQSCHIHYYSVHKSYCFSWSHGRPVADVSLGSPGVAMCRRWSPTGRPPTTP